MKLLFLCAFVGSVPYALLAQPLERTVIGSSGDYQSHPSLGNLHFTAGELMVEVFQNGPGLSHGFQQGYYNVVSAIEGKTAFNEMLRVFPNPTDSWLQLESSLPGILEIELTDLLGGRLFTNILTPNSHLLNLQLLPEGIYLLRVSREGRPIRTFRIQKVNH